MRRDEYDRLAEEAAREALTPEDFETLKEAMTKGSFVIFTYQKWIGGVFRYRMVWPRGWILAGKSYLWAYHTLHERNHSFITEHIRNVVLAADIISALTNPQQYPEFWDGSQFQKNTTREV